MKMLTLAEMEQAVVDGDAYCQCGCRKSLHGTPQHPAVGPRTKACNNSRFVRSSSFNEAVLLHREHEEPTLFPDDQDAA